MDLKKFIETYNEYKKLEKELEVMKRELKESGQTVFTHEDYLILISDEQRAKIDTGKFIEKCDKFNLPFEKVLPALSVNVREARKLFDISDIATYSTYKEITVKPVKSYAGNNTLSEVTTDNTESIRRIEVAECN